MERIEELVKRIEALEKKNEDLETHIRMIAKDEAEKEINIYNKKLNDKFRLR